MRNVRRRYRAKAEEFEERMVVPLLWILARGGPHGLGLRELAHATMVSTNTLNRRLLELRKRGLAIRTDKGRWVSMVMLVPVLPLEAQKPVQDPLELLPVLEAAQAPADPPTSPISDKAQRLATKFSVPARIGEHEVVLGPPRPCTECKCMSVLRYGVAAVCPRCARAWDASGKMGGEDAQ